MNIRHLITRNIFLYKSFYRLIAIAAAVAVAVIAGSLMVGDSVRSTLINRVEERLGKTQTIIFSRYSFMDERMVVETRLIASLHVNGFVSVSGKMVPVMVWGRDDMGITRGQTKINHALYNEIKTPPTTDIVLRLPSAGMVPVGSMYVTDTYTTTLRLTLDSVISVEEGGNLNLKNEQTLPFNIFVNRQELAEAMGVPGKINIILSEQLISKDDIASTWNWSHSGLNVHTDHHGATITSDRIFLQDPVVQALCEADPSSNRIYAYLANSIRKGAHSIPYSFVTAVDGYKGEALAPDEIILSDYAAKRLNVSLHDTISVTYYVSQQLKTLKVDSVSLTVGKIVPLSDLQADDLYKADFPGLSNAARCTDWDSDLPINMHLITDEDEAYWTTYKNTPKALLPYPALAPRWKNSYGSATALRLSNGSKGLNDLTHEMFDIQVIYPKEAGMIAAMSGVDFASLFLSLGIFIVISAIMLMMVPLSEMLFCRGSELSLLRAIGFSRKRFVRLLWRESAPVVGLAAMAGVAVGLVYTFLVLFLLGNVWRGATHTEGFRVYLHFMPMVTGLLSGVIISLFVLYVQIIRSNRHLRMTV